MNVFARVQAQCKRNECHYQVNKPLLSCFVEHRYWKNSFLRRPCARNICSIFSLCIKTLPQDIFCAYSFNGSTNSLNLKSWVLISLKIVLIFPTNFLNFRLVKTDKPGVINYSNYSMQVLSDSEITFLQETPQWCIIKEACHQISLFSTHQENFVEARSFSALNFDNCVKSFLCKLFRFDVKMAIKYFFSRVIWYFRRVSKKILGMFSSILKFSFLVA